MRDCLSISIALVINHTEISALVYNSKNNKDQHSNSQLSGLAAQAIQVLPYYKDADLICSVPPGPDKDFDLPSSVTSLVSGKIGKRNVTGGFTFGGQKSSVKTSTFDEKWNVWKSAKVSFQNKPAFNVSGKTVVLVDDMYQSGITIQYIAMKLQQAGARKVYGLSFVKTLRDTANV